jgi:hypothetical protein
MADYTAFDYTADFYVKAPITFEMMRALAENPQAIAEGAVGAPRVAIDVDGQTAIETDETSINVVLRPDGVGGVEWGSEQANSPPRYFRYEMRNSGVGSNTVGNPAGAGDNGTNYGGSQITFSDGIFTVPDDGVYSIHWSITVLSGTPQIELQKNSVRVPTMPAATYMTADGSQSCIIDLNAGDDMRLRDVGGGQIVACLSIARV